MIKSDFIAKVTIGTMLFVYSSFVFSETFSVASVGIDTEANLVFVVMNRPSTQEHCVNKAEFKWSLSESSAFVIYSLALHAHKENIQIDIGRSSECVDNQPTARWIKLRH